VQEGVATRLAFTSPTGRGLTGCEVVTAVRADGGAGREGEDGEEGRGDQRVERAEEEEEMNRPGYC
jgi:hypothetical protein